VEPLSVKALLGLLEQREHLEGAEELVILDLPGIQHRHRILRFLEIQLLRLLEIQLLRLLGM
jgi:hypothetical protein